MNNHTKKEQFKQIVDENSERIMRICRYYNPNVEDRKDMYQEILVNVWKSLDKFRGDSKISTWVYRIAINTSLNFTGKAFRQMKLVVDKDVQNMGLLVDDEVQLKQQYESDLETLQTHLNLLSVIEKAMISLMLEGLSMREISDVIGLTESNVRVKIHRIKEKLKEQILEGNTNNSPVK
ncbi:MAG: RNA polymerase sigma factor [Prolixibacteraceae bacterium]|jgi:RNA polymerase sigma-70 factor (ECF subfamily)|nr:RNA polymerase sigma factor [Prolixibacteraceae bacterium]